jgi:hypothetical protein
VKPVVKSKGGNPLMKIPERQNEKPKQHLTVKPQQ